MKNNKYRIMLIFSMIIFGTIGLFVKMIPLSSGEVALYRAVLAIFLISVYFLITKRKLNFVIVKKELLLLFMSGLAMGTNWILLFESYKYTSVSVATLSYYFAPIIVMVLSTFLFKEKNSIKQWICFIFSTIGLVLITNVDVSGENKQHLIGILLGLGAALFYATVIILNKYIKNVQGIDRTFLQFVSSIFILIPYVIFTTGINLNILNGINWIYLLIIGLIHTGVTYCLYFSSLEKLPGQKTAILSYIDPLVAVLISIFILKETMTILQIIGGVLILGFTLLNEINIKKKNI